MEGAAPDPAIASKKTPLGTGPWYRYRHLIYALLASNVAMVYYVVLNQDKFFPRKQEQSDLKEGADRKKAPVAAEKKIDQPKTFSEEKKPEKKLEVPAAAVIKRQEQHVSSEEQIQIYKWMLEEKRKMKPSSPEEKARIDLEKGVLKDYIRGKVPSLTN